MKKTRNLKRYIALLFAVIVIAISFVSCEASVIPPEVLATTPIHGSTGAAINGNITATFKDAMDPSTVTGSTFVVSKDGSPIAGIVTYDVPNKEAVFSPSANLSNSKVYTATMTTGMKTSAGVTMEHNKVWSFTTASLGIGPSPVLLRTAGNYVILAKSAISSVPSSVITGDVGISPAAESFITGFSQTDATGYATSPQVTGFLYAADMAPPTNTKLTTAVEDMLSAYTDAAGRIVTSGKLNVNNGTSGAIGGMTLEPGVYKWDGNVSIGSDITIVGGANDTWIFQIDGILSLASATKVILSGGAQAKNIVWQVAGVVTLGSGSSFKGIVLCEESITLQTASTLNGRLLSKKLIALEQATVTNSGL